MTKLLLCILTLYCLAPELEFVVTSSGGPYEYDRLVFRAEQAPENPDDTKVVAGLTCDPGATYALSGAPYEGQEACIRALLQQSIETLSSALQDLQNVLQDPDLKSMLLDLRCGGWRNLQDLDPTSNLRYQEFATRNPKIKITSENVVRDRTQQRICRNALVITYPDISIDLSGQSIASPEYASKIPISDQPKLLAYAVQTLQDMMGERLGRLPKSDCEWDRELARRIAQKQNTEDATGVHWQTSGRLNDAESLSAMRNAMKQVATLHSLARVISSGVLAGVIYAQSNRCVLNRSGRVTISNEMAEWIQNNSNVTRRVYYGPGEDSCITCNPRSQRSIMLYIDGQEV